MTQHPSPRYLPETLKNIYSQRYMHHCVYWGSGQDRETAKVCFDRGLDKEDVVHIHNGILLNRKKRWNTAICDNVDRL